MSDIVYFMYRNDNGITVHKLDSIQPADVRYLYLKMLREHKDDYYATDGYILFQNEEGLVHSAEEIFIPEIDEGEIDNPGDLFLIVD